MSETAKRMMSLFSGFSAAHGTYTSTTPNHSKGGKLEIKKTARTLREPVTEELWDKHLSGDRPLGIIPIREDQCCVWGCIDVDRYDINHAEVVVELRRKGLPLVVCRTKSGGAHAFIFFKTPVPAEVTRALLRQMAAAMGWGDCEIFPKQNQILDQRGDLGNWLNMPYLGGDETDRYAVKESMGGYSVVEFLHYAESMKVDSPDSVDIPEADDDSLSDGPPCLQHLATVGFPDGTRNNGLFALGVFCRKKYGAKWQEKLEQYNREYMRPPLPAEEVAGLIRNLERKEYQYTCKDQPLVSYCNSTLCRMRKFGVGGSGKYPVISGISKLDTEEPIWFVDIEEDRIELTTNELQNYREFQKACMNQLTVYFLPMKAETWGGIVSEAMANAIIIEPAEEMTTMGHFVELLEDFCTGKYVGQRQEDLFLGKPWFDEEGKRYYFRLKDLMSHLERKGFKVWGRNKVGAVLDQMGGKRGMNVKGSFLNTFWVDASFETPPEIGLPEKRKEPI